jgi:hypothetical protein
MTIGEQGNYDLEGRDPVDLMDFKVTAEGKTVESTSPSRVPPRLH